MHGYDCGKLYQLRIDDRRRALAKLDGMGPVTGIHCEQQSHLVSHNSQQLPAVDGIQLEACKGPCVEGQLVQKTVLEFPFVIAAELKGKTHSQDNALEKLITKFLQEKSAPDREHIRLVYK